MNEGCLNKYQNIELAFGPNRNKINYKQIISQKEINSLISFLSNFKLELMGFVKRENEERRKLFSSSPIVTEPRFTGTNNLQKFEKYGKMLMIYRFSYLSIGKDT